MLPAFGAAVSTQQGRCKSGPPPVEYGAVGGKTVDAKMRPKKSLATSSTGHGTCTTTAWEDV